MDALEELINTLGPNGTLQKDDDTKPGTDTGSEDKPENDNTDTTGGSDGSQTDSTDNTGADGGTDESSSDTNDQNKDKDNKAAQAFAAMRINNTKYQNILQGLGKVLKIQNDNPDAIINAVSDLVTKAEAKQQGIPVEILQRLQQLEQLNTNVEQERITRNAALGFQNIKTKFNLTDKDLEGFADSLIAANINPFQQEVDVYKEYITRNFDKLVENAIQKGIQDEAARASKAGQQSTTPDQKNGQGNAEVSTINSVAALNKWLDEQK